MVCQKILNGLSYRFWLKDMCNDGRMDQKQRDKHLSYISKVDHFITNSSLLRMECIDFSLWGNSNLGFICDAIASRIFRTRYIFIEVSSTVVKADESFSLIKVTGAENFYDISILHSPQDTSLTAHNHRLSNLHPNLNKINFGWIGGLGCFIGNIYRFNG